MVPNVFSIFTGDDKVMSLKAVNVGCNADPLDLSSCTEIIVTLPNADGTQLQLKLSLGKVAISSPAVLGRFTASISAADSAPLNPGELQTFDATFTIGGRIFTVPFVNALSVFERQ